MLHPLSLGAQRTAVGESLVDLSLGTSLSGWSASARYGQYLSAGYWWGGAALTDRRETDLPSGEAVRYPRAELRGGAAFRLLGTYSRSLGLYGGADVFIGVEMLDPLRALSPSTFLAYQSAGYTPTRFIYGAAPEILAEWFPFPRLALTLSGRMSITVGTPFPLIGWELSAGARINIQ